MRIHAIAAAVLVMALGAAPAHAGAGRSFGFNGGLTVPAGTFSSLSESGVHFGATFCQKLTSRLGLGVELNQHGLGDKTVNIVTSRATGVATLHTSTLEAGAIARLFLPMSVSTAEPYLQLGLAGYHSNYSADVAMTTGTKPATALARASGTHLGYSFGGGLLIATGTSSSVGIAAMYHLVPVTDAAENFYTWTLSYNFSTAR